MSTGIRERSLLVPQRAVTELQGGYQIAIVDAANKVSIRPVKVGETVASQWIISDGVKPGERVIAEGVQKVRTGITVKPTLYAAQSKD